MRSRGPAFRSIASAWDTLRVEPVTGNGIVGDMGAISGRYPEERIGAVKVSELCVEPLAVDRCKICVEHLMDILHGLRPLGARHLHGATAGQCEPNCDNGKRSDDSGSGA
ncbi:MAG: hypothetical protein A3G43_09230 [Ignavibacteria bacterium RIFCSPLOWO2_12_FULL_56_21]|nr:MAG: hypothetical protein A3G43_09230 [Ignavibacteria bacterium RIFCSPLOWO2_12_FULL_56_21]